MRPDDSDAIQPEIISSKKLGRSWILSTRRQVFLKKQPHSIKCIANLKHLL